MNQNKMKVIPVYLPQFHTIPENDEWWGKGFTEWRNVKNAKPLFEGHFQPRTPLNENYYDLSDVNTLKWQAELAKKYGIYGFCMYHYYFNGHKLLEKPMEMLLAHPEIDLKYCVCWANHDWTDGWKATDGHERILIAHDFDDEASWVEHFNYLLPFFKDSRYISEDNKPFMVIYVPNMIKKLNKMLTIWNNMAKEAGFNGLTFIYQSAMSCVDPCWDRSMFDYGVHFQPGYVSWASRSQLKTMFLWRAIKLSRILKRIFKIKKRQMLDNVPKDVCKFDYDECWQNILKLRPDDDHTIPGGFVDWDNTPRKQMRGMVAVGATPEKFKKYFRQLVINTRKFYKQDKIFFFAWNEWAEGGYLEPDEKYKYAYLEAIKEVLDEDEKGF